MIPPGGVADIALPSRPNCHRDREPLQVAFRQPFPHADPEAIKEPVDLPDMLRCMPGGTLHELVRRLLTVVGDDAAVTPAWIGTETLQPATYLLAVRRNRRAVLHLRRRLLEQPRLRELALLPAIREGGTQAKDVERKLTECPIAIRRLRRKLFSGYR